VGSDAQEILHHLILTSGETENMLRYPDEFTMTAEEERAYLDEVAARPDAILISAIVDGRIVACAGFNPVSKFEKCRHRAEFGISVQREFWGLGIGSCLTAAVLSAARQAGCTQLELDVVAENRRAIGLYEKFGFRICGTNDRAFLSRSGAYQPLHLMVRPL